MELQLKIDNIPAENEESKEHQQHLQNIRSINKRHLDELNGKETSRTSLIEEQTKPNLGKRFRKY